MVAVSHEEAGVRLVRNQYLDSYLHNPISNEWKKVPKDSELFFEGGWGFIQSEGMNSSWVKQLLVKNIFKTAEGRLY
eukprot:10219317-Lingulodinium_polyedra.AAC.1